MWNKHVCEERGLKQTCLWRQIALIHIQHWRNGKQFKTKAGSYSRGIASCQQECTKEYKDTTNTYTWGCYLLIPNIHAASIGTSQCLRTISIMCFWCKITYNSIQVTETVQFNSNDFNIITLTPNVTNVNHGYLMVWISRQLFIQNKTHQVTFKVQKADRPVI